MQGKGDVVANLGGDPWAAIGADDNYALCL